MARPKLHDDALAEELLQQAAVMISAGGPEALSVRKVSQAAGTSTSAVYSLYGSRESLLSAVYERAARGFAESQMIEPSGSAREDLIQHSMNYRQWALDNPNLYPVMFDGRSGRQSGELRSFGRSTIQPLVAAVRRAMDEGFLREANEFHVAVALWTTVHGYVTLELADMFSADFAGDSGIDAQSAYYNFTLSAVAYWVTDIDALRSRVKRNDA